MANILLIDDDPAIGQILTTAFENKKHHLSIALTAKAGFNVAKLEKPDCIILDQILPDKHGVSLLEDITVEESIKDIPVIIFTDYSDPVVQKESERLGAKGFILKFDIAPNALVTVVEETINKHLVEKNDVVL